MKQQTALGTIATLTSAINRGDIDSMLELFDEEAVLVVQALAGQPGQIARGRAAIHYLRWSLTVTAPDGSRIDRSAMSSDVLRKLPDGRWHVLIYNPYGSSMVEK